MADIHRKYQAISGMPINYKPFHNQIKKSHCTDFFKDCFEKVLKEWVVESLKLTSLSTGESFPFERVLLHDGCSFGIHSGLKDTFPGRFTKHTPAAVELHIIMDLMCGSIDYFALTADTESEQLHSPVPENLDKTLTLEDAGYFDRSKIIQHAYDYEGNEVEKWQDQKLKLKQLALRNKKIPMDLTVRWPGYNMDFRVIAFWYKKKKRIGYLVTNLHRGSVKACDIVGLYRLRWQIERLFKELKSYCNLKKFSTENKHIVKTLIYANFITVLLKRLLAFSTEQIKSICISTQKTGRAANE